jgi:hypothetical protein
VRKDFITTPISSAAVPPIKICPSSWSNLAVARMKQPLAATALLVASMTGAQAEPSQYICVVEHAAGLHYDRQADTWLPHAFGTSTWFGD